MKTITINAPKDLDCDKQQWPAQYDVAAGSQDVALVRIQSRSAIDVLVAKVAENGFLGLQESYYISVPNFGIAIPGIPSLQETFWITEQLLRHELPVPDAITVAQVLRDFGDF